MVEKCPDDLIREALEYLRNWKGQPSRTRYVNAHSYPMVEVSILAIQEVIDLLQGTRPRLEREMLERLLTKYFGDDMAKSLLITLGVKGPPVLEER